MQNKNALKCFWRSKGYGWLLDISGTDCIRYDKTGISCLESRHWSAAGFSSFFDRFEIDKHEFSMYRKGGITRYTFQRQDDFPEKLLSVSRSREKDPVFNFEVFWRSFAENYAFFDLRGVNWNQMYQTYRPQVSQKTSDDELLDIFTECIQLLGDLHVSLHTGDRHISSAKPHALLTQWQQEFGMGYSMELFIAGFTRLSELITNEFLNGTGKSAANDRVIWGSTAPNIGYLMVIAMSGFAEDEGAGTAENLAALEAAMDQVMDDFRGMDGVILDMRFNGGGEDAASLLIANRFADRKRLAFTKKAVDGNGFTAEQEIYIYPEGEYQFTGPTMLLTSEATISAAEIFTLGMLSLPHVTRIGEPTQGVLSDVLVKRLPNGWHLGISNEIYTASDGSLYEKAGIPVHINVPIFDTNDFYPNLKTALDRAVTVINQKY